MDQFQLSVKIPCDGGLLALSPDGQLFAAMSRKRIVVSSSSTLLQLMSFPTCDSVKILKFSPDSKYLSWLSTNPHSLNICHVHSKNILEIPIDPGLEVVSLIYGVNCLLFISELEVFIGVYDFKKHKSFTLEGCSLDDSDRPLVTFSPWGDYLVYVRGHQLDIYCTETWNLKSSFNCPISPGKPRFVNPYTIFLFNHDGVIEWFTIFGSKIKSDAVLPSNCIVSTEISKDSRTLFCSTYHNKVLSFDTISMESREELEYVYFTKPEAKVRNFVATHNVELHQNVRLLKFKETDQIPVRELKNVMDQFKRKSETQHFIALNHDDTLLATYNPDNLNTVWVWDFTKEYRLESVISLNETAGKIKALRWHRFSNRLAICFSDLVVIWSEWDDLLGFQGDNMDFKWLKIQPAVGVLNMEGDCRFVYFK